MWSVVAILKSECDSSVQVESPPVPLSNYPIWCPAKISLDGYELGYNNLIIEFVLQCSQGRIFITSISIPAGRFNYIREVEEQSPSIEKTFIVPAVSNILDIESVSISYIAYKYKEDGFNMLGQIHISTLSLKYDIESIIKPTGHRITCLVNEIYLSRPQECKTDGGMRLYYWRGKNQTGVGQAFSLSPRGESDFQNLQRDNSDISLIRMATPAGIKKHATVINHVPDNDAYSNPNHKLPIYFQDSDKPLTFKFFNFKFTPPKCIEYVLKWKDFMSFRTFIRNEPLETKKGLMKRKLSSPRPVQMCMLNREIADNIHLMIHFMVVDATKIELVMVYIKVLNYEDTLEMNKLQERVTV